MITITLRQIRDANPRAEGWAKILATLGYTDGQYDPERTVTLGDIALMLGIPNVWWFVRFLPDDVATRRLVLRAQLPGVRWAAQHTIDERVLATVAAVSRWTDGDDTVDLQAWARTAGEMAAMTWAGEAVGAVETVEAVAAMAESAAAGKMAAVAEAAEAAVMTAALAVAMLAPVEMAGAAAEMEYQLQVYDIIAVFGLSPAQETGSCAP